MESIYSWFLKKTSSWFVSWSFRKIFGKKNLVVFEKILELPKWKKVSFENNEKWIYEEDNSFTLEVSGKSRDFSEDWTSKFPNKKSFATEVYLKINGELINRPLLFIAVDGWNNFVPCPQRSEINSKSFFYWVKESLEYKVFQRIGFLYPPYKNLKEFGEKCGVQMK